MDIPLLLPAGQQVNVNKNLYYDAGALYGRPALVATPGLVAFTYAGTGTHGVPSGAVTALYSDPGLVYLYAIIGSVFYKMTPNYSTNVMTLSDHDNLTGFTTNSPCSIERNDLGVYVLSNQAYFTNGAMYSYVVSSGTLAPLTAASPNEGLLTYQDRMFISAEMGLDAIAPSDLSAITWADYDPSSASGYPDVIYAIKSHKRKVYAFGGKSVEVFMNTGDATAPFSRIEGSTLNIGCSAPYSVARLGDSLYWFTNTGQVARTSGVGGFQIVSVPQMERLWSQFAWTDDAIGVPIVWMGREWYAIRFVSAGKSYVFDALAADLGLFPWFEWSTGLLASEVAIPIMSSTITDSTTSGVNTLMGGSSGGKIYKLSHSTYANDGTAFTTRWYPNPIIEDHRIIRHHQIDIDLYEAAVSSTQNLRYTDTRGRSYVTPTEITMGVGSGYYNQLFRWSMLGHSRDRQYDWYCSDAIQRAIFGASLTASKGVL
jgi:hypothetical protein